MKPIRLITIVAVCAFFAFPVIAHHPAQSILDEEIWEHIDEMVADTPHATLDLSGMGADIDMAEISTDRIRDLEDLIANDLLDFVALLDGEVTLTIDFYGPHDFVMTIEQNDDLEGDNAKAMPPADATTLDALKADFR
jgi:hypothetical protein